VEGASECGPDSFGADPVDDKDPVHRALETETPCKYVPRFLRERRAAEEAEGTKAVKASSPGQARPYVPRFLREPWADVRTEGASEVCDDASAKKQGAAPGPLNDLRCVGRGSSASSTASEASSLVGFASSGLSATSAGSRVRFWDPDDDLEDVRVEVCEVARLTKSEIVGCELEGTFWCRLAEYRSERLSLRLHGKSCCRGRDCCGVPGQGICTLGGSLVADFAIGLEVVLAAWRVQAGIPSTVPMSMLKRGVSWPKRAV